MEINRSSLIYKAVLKIWVNINSPRLSESDKKFVSKIKVVNGGTLMIDRIIPRRCEREGCTCNGLHWSIFDQPIEMLKQKEQNKLFAIAGRF